MELTSEQKKEIQEQQSQSNSTKRVTSPELEKVLYEAIPVLRSWIYKSHRLHG
jgi:thymidylate synthase (FAD)